MESAIPVAKSTASWRVDGFSFQFPVMNGFRVNNRVDVGSAGGAINADTPPDRQANTDTTAIFMVMIRSYCYDIPLPLVRRWF